SGREVSLRRAGNVADLARDADRIVLAAPSGPFQCDAHGQGFVDLREFVSFLAAVVEACAREDAEFAVDLLFQIDRAARPGGVLPYQSRARDRMREQSELHRVVVIANPTAIEKAQ